LDYIEAVRIQAVVLELRCGARMLWYRMAEFGSDVQRIVLHGEISHNRKIHSKHTHVKYRVRCGGRGDTHRIERYCPGVLVSNAS
jgi:hypothetical protein